MLEAFQSHLKTYLTDEEINALIAGIFSPRFQGLLLNTHKISEDKLLKYFPQLNKHPLIPNAFIYQPTLISPGKHFLFDAGAYYSQDLSAMLVGHFLPVNNDEIVADLCAAPGGKSYQVALKNPNAFLISNDISGLRAKAMAQNLERFGLANIIITNHDAHDLLKMAPFQFDKIILDAPCSGSGMFKKREDMINDWSYNKVLKFSEVQKELIVHAYQRLKPGGQLIYSTCSFSYEENEEVIKHLLTNSEAKVIPLPSDPSFYPSKDIPGSIHLFPHLYQGDGHYICLLSKPGLEERSPLKRPTTSTFGAFKLPLEIIKKGEHYFGVNAIVKTPFHVIRPGIFLGTIEKNITSYNHHLALYLSTSVAFAINEYDKNRYLQGESFLINGIPDGYQIVSYDGLNLGWVKAKNGIVKNHYPKGLRLR